MAQPYVGEIRLFAGNFAPADWMFCEGQTLSISEYETLFQLIGTTYGGDGQETFDLPDLRGRSAVHQGNGYVMAQAGGLEVVTLAAGQMPAHAHTMLADTSVGTGDSPTGHTLGTPPSDEIYVTAGGARQALAPTTSTGDSQPHDNRQPYLCLNHIISLFGIFPSPS